ncbi:flagellar hook assembly protein FlgD [Massilia sp. GCM10023247]|uniref:flagellar hook assembly protein FlgD n=1 Tax=Massilia sp. GCM10023247 TaxID=3252643 RepID=UPI00360FFD9D
MSTVTSAGTSINDLMSTMNTKKKASTDSVQADTDKFMTLLVTQLKNQDPLNPLDNAQVTSQLAQLQTVTGVNKLNETLETLKSSYQSTEAMQATNLIGHGVLVEGNNLNLIGGKSVFGVELATAADNVQVIVTDPRTGKDVASIELGANEAGALPLVWDGSSDGVDAAQLGDGNYSFRVVATRGGQPLTDVKALSLDTVASVSTNSKDGVKLNLAGKGAITLADIKQVL